MLSGALASIIAAMALGVAEGMGRFYPAHDTWWRLRRRHGRRAVRAMRERFEAVADRKLPRLLALVLLGLVIGWVASASLLDKRAWEVALDVFPYVLVGVALLRVPSIMRKVGGRMREFERQAGEDPDRPLDDQTGDGDGGPSTIAL
jgi:hypothetical protein